MAHCLNPGHTYRIDIIDADGNITSSVKCEQGLMDVPVLGGNTMILSRKGETYRIYNEDGKAVTDELYLSAELIGEYVVVSNLDGEYGIMDQKGQRRVPYGRVGDQRSIYGTRWKDIYTIDDMLCIVIYQGEGSKVLVF